MIKQLVYIVTILFVLVSCNNDVAPKPKGFLSLDYPEPVYKQLRSTCPYTFNMNGSAEIEIPKGNQSCAMNISYPRLKGKIHLTYRKVSNNIDVLLKDAQDLTQKHTIKADGILTYPYERAEQKAYGMVYDVEGDAASPIQFYMTDSINHFLLGSVYFYAKPNYDSILPAAHYLKKDIKVLMESLKWQE